MAVGDIWEHYKGNRYREVCRATHADSGETFISYQKEDAADDSPVWCLSVTEFQRMMQVPADNARWTQRFKFISAEN